MAGTSHYLIFTLDDQRYALPLESVLEVIRAVKLTPLPDAPPNLMGLLNLRGRIVPVLDIRRRFHLPVREMELNDRIVICRGTVRTIAFVADDVEGVVELTPGEVDEAVKILPDMDGYMDGVGRLRDRTVLIYDLETLFSIKEVEELRIDEQDPTND